MNEGTQKTVKTEMGRCAYIVRVNLQKLLFEAMVNRREIVIGLCEKVQKPICRLVVLMLHFRFTLQC